SAPLPPAEPCGTVENAAPPDSILALFARASVPYLPLDELRKIDWSYRDSRGRNAVHWSVRVGNPSATMGMVQGHAPIDLPDVDGVTPLMVALGRADAWHAEVLLDAGANARAANATGQTPLMYLAASCTPVNGAGTTLRAPEAALLRLVKEGADLDAQDRRGHTALMHATRGSGLRVRDLLAAGANPHLVDQAGRTALQIAALTPASPDNGYIRALLELASAEADWSALPPESREANLAEVEALASLRERNDPARPLELPADSVFILPLRP
ncbi:MAG TPA: ankyrin repeat domain-containing protein, partial [Longimicrobium sp.]|nr:ankyrin repeat domain-containing protein [Longimicrobium sp.]